MKSFFETISALWITIKFIYSLLTDEEEMRQYNYDYNGGEE